MIVTAEIVYVTTILFEYLNAHGLLRKAAKQGMLDTNNPLQRVAYKHQLAATGLSYLMTAVLGMLAIWVSYWVAGLVANTLVAGIVLFIVLVGTFVVRNLISSLVVTLLNNHFKEHLSVKREKAMTDAQEYAQDTLKKGTLSAAQLNDLIDHMKGE